MKRALTSAGSTFVVQGASRGLGLAFVEHFLAHAHPKARIVATCRNPSDRLSELIESHGTERCHVERLDVEDPSTIEACAERLQKSHGNVDVLLNVAGKCFVVFSRNHDKVGRMLCRS